MPADRIPRRTQPGVLNSCRHMASLCFSCPFVQREWDLHLHWGLCVVKADEGGEASGNSETPAE
jgi:hypothetical protein